MGMSHTSWLEYENNQLKQEKKELKQEIESLKKYNEELKKQRDGLTTTNYHSTEENQQLKQTLKETREFFVDKHVENEQLKELLEQYKYDLTYAEYRIIPTLEEENEELKQENEKLEKENESLQELSNYHKDKKIDYWNEIQKLQKDLKENYPYL